MFVCVFARSTLDHGTRRWRTSWHCRCCKTVKTIGQLRVEWGQAIRPCRRGRLQTGFGGNTIRHCRHLIALGCFGGPRSVTCCRRTRDDGEYCIGRRIKNVVKPETVHGFVSRTHSLCIRSISNRNNRNSVGRCGRRRDQFLMIKMMTLAWLRDGHGRCTYRFAGRSLSTSKGRFAVTAVLFSLAGTFGKLSSRTVVRAGRMSTSRGQLLRELALG